MALMVMETIVGGVMAWSIGRGIGETVMLQKSSAGGSISHNGAASAPRSPLEYKRMCLSSQAIHGFR